MFIYHPTRILPVQEEKQRVYGCFLASRQWRNAIHKSIEICLRDKSKWKFSLFKTKETMASTWHVCLHIFITKLNFERKERERERNLPVLVRSYSYLHRVIRAVHQPAETRTQGRLALQISAATKKGAEILLKWVLVGSISYACEEGQ